MSGGGGVDGHMQGSTQVSQSMYGQSIKEMKKMDLFDLSVCLTISATDGLDMVNEEFLCKLASYKNHCCLLHALTDIDTDTD